jgi:nitronate monooxygenase
LNVNYPLWPAPEVTAEAARSMRARLQPLYDDKGLGEAPQPTGSAGEVDADHLAMLLAARPEVVSFHFGMPPAETTRALKAAGVFIVSSATTVAEARRLEEAGADAIIAQGSEAGGHRATFAGTDISMQPGLFALLPQVVDAVSVPVIAAGGVAEARTAAAAFVLGASAVQLGTAFLRCAEANLSDAHRVALAEADDASTVVSEMVTGRPARMIRNRLVDELAASGLATLPFPAQLSLTGRLAASGDPQLDILMSGQSAALTREMGAAELVQSLAEQIGARLSAVS